MLDLADIRKRNAGQPDGYWKTTVALCDEVERLSKPPAADLDNIRRMLDDGVPVPPWLVRGLVEYAARWRGQASNWADNIAVLTREHDSLLAAVCAWSDAIEQCNGIVAAEETLRDMVRVFRAKPATP